MHEIEHREARPLSRAFRRRAERAERQRAEPATPQTREEINRAGMERATYFRAKLDRALAMGGQAGAEREAKAMLIGTFAHLVAHSSIEEATRIISGAISDIAGQALIKRAQDIQAGRRPPMTPGELG